MTPRPSRSGSADQAVADLLNALETQHAGRAQSPAERRKQAKARAKAARRTRVMLDLPPTLIQRIKTLAHDLSAPESQVAALLLRAGLAELDAGRLDPLAHRAPSRSPRYDWILTWENSDE